MPTSSNVLCGCGTFMRPKKNSVTVEELFEDGSGYKLWDADLFSCSNCAAQVIVGFGSGPIAEHYEPTYTETRGRLAHHGPIYPGRCSR